MERDPSGEAFFPMMRGPFGDCVPHLFLDGAQLHSMSAADIDDWVKPEDVRGIEVYGDAVAPAQFRSSWVMESCGSIVIWTRGVR